MCNCGNKREQFTGQSYHAAAGSFGDGSVKRTGVDAFFEYTGHSALTVAGPVSGKRYRFSRPGEIQVIDYRDASSMMGVPVLRRVKAPD